MDSSNLIIDSSVSSLTAQQQLSTSVDKTDAAKMKFAKDFEGVFINKLLDEMKNTIGEWGEEKDGASQQVDGMFWMFLGDGLTEQGGFGMWKDIYKSLSDTENTTGTSTLDKQI